MSISISVMDKMSEELINNYATLIFNVYGYEIYKNESSLEELKHMNLCSIRDLFESLILSYLVKESKLKLDYTDNEKLKLVKVENK